MIRRATVALLALVAFTPEPSFATDEVPDCINGNLHQAYSDCYVPGSVLGAVWATAPMDTFYRLTPICLTAPYHTETACITGQLRCTDPPDAYRYWLWRSVDGSPFEPIGTTCLRDEDAGGFDVITPGKVLAEMKRLTWPGAELTVQPPDGRTLVNLETNFFTTTTETSSQTVTLLGHQVEIEATPVDYTWRFGDGTTDRGPDPGAPYPDLRVTHTYLHADMTVRPSVDVTYHGRYRLEGGPWQDIPEELTVAGAPVELDVLSATPLLVG